MAGININQVLREVEQISASADPWSQLNTYLRLAQDPDAVSALVNSDADTLYQGVNTLLNDLFDPGHYSYFNNFGRVGTNLPGSNRPWPETTLSRYATAHQVRPLTSGNIPSGQVPFGDAAREARHITLRANPGQRLALRTGFLSNPLAQGVVGGLRARQQGATRNNRFGLSHFGRMRDQSQQRLIGEAAAFGTGRNAFRRELLGNTPASRGQQLRINPSYRRV